jgi:hypothetical protein
VGPFGWEVVGSLAGVASVVLTIVFGVAPWIQRRRAVRDAVPALALAPNRKSYLSRGESLHVGESLHSPDARTKFTLLDNANMVVSVAGLGDICDTGTTNRDVPGYLKLEDSGWLILYDNSDEPLWRQGPRGYRLEVQDNSHVVLYPPVADGDAIWATDLFFKAGQLVRWIPPAKDGGTSRR